MPRVYVQFAGMKQLEDSWTSIASQIEEIQSNFSSTVKNLDWDIQCQSDISAAASRLSGSLENYQQALKSYHSFFQQAYDAYQKLDQNQEGQDSFQAPSAEKIVAIASLWTPLSFIKSIIELLIALHQVGTSNYQEYVDSNGHMPQWALFLKNFVDMLMVTAAHILPGGNQLEACYQDYLKNYEEYEKSGGDMSQLELTARNLLDTIYDFASSNPEIKDLLKPLEKAWEEITGETITDWSAGVIDDQASSGPLGWIGQGVEALGDVISDGLDFVNDLWNHLFNGG